MPPMFPPDMQQAPSGPNGAMTGGPAVGRVQLPPGPQAAQLPQQDAMALANQLYVTQQQMATVMQELADMRQRRRVIEFAVNRDQDGRVTTITAMEGSQ